LGNYADIAVISPVSLFHVNKSSYWHIKLKFEKQKVMTMKTKITLLKMHWIILCSLCMSCSFAQTWQWGKRGGGDGSINDSYSTERVKRIVTDSHGNVYALCSVSSPNLDID